MKKLFLVSLITAFCLGLCIPAYSQTPPLPNDQKKEAVAKSDNKDIKCAKKANCPKNCPKTGKKCMNKPGCCKKAKEIQDKK
ncbi:MAG: hypothetical protein Q8880_04140 [Bacteroidota bacterium]|nr:hypothetical protein [Bacteroidota bacterium]